MLEAEANPDQSASYRLVQTLVPDRTFLCTDVSNNIVVLKQLDNDCLHRTQLHPGIRDRLAKVRELPHPKLATLRSVERWNGRTCMMWVYLDGLNWNEAIAAPSADVSALSSALIATVETLHELGIVHGNLHGGNIIVRPDGQVWLTDISPYLYSDPNDDLNTIAALLPADLPRKSRNLKSPVSQHGNHIRFTSTLAAVMLVVTAIGFGAIWHRKFAKPISRVPSTFPSLQQTPRP